MVFFVVVFVCFVIFKRKSVVFLMPRFNYVNAHVIQISYIFQPQLKKTIYVKKKKGKKEMTTNESVPWLYRGL